MHTKYSEIKPSTLFELCKALSHVIDEQSFSMDAGVSLAHSGDWSEAPRHCPGLVIFPRTPMQVAAVLRVLSDRRQPVVIQGGLTGLAGAATPQEGEVALSLTKLNQIEGLDTVGGTVTVQAGVTLEQLQSHVEAENWFFPMDLGARGSCQIGGNASTNAGGNRVLRYGTMRDLTLGIEVAMTDGRLMTMLNQSTKNTTGIDLKHLFIGAEGALGVITRLVLRLSPKPTSINTALCAMDSFESATQLLRHLRAELPALSAFELMWEDFMVAAVQTQKSAPPFARAYPLYVLIETLGASEGEDRGLLERALERALESNLLCDVVVAQSLEDTRKLWAYRESVGEMLAQMKPHAAFDVGIPIPSMAKFVATTRSELQRRFPQQSHLFFGHIGDGNLHVLSGAYGSDKAIHDVEQIVYKAASEVGGCISAEHGIGIIKKEFLPLSRSPIEIEMMRHLKSLFDPSYVLNPGRVIDSLPTALPLSLATGEKDAAGSCFIVEVLIGDGLI